MTADPVSRRRVLAAGASLALLGGCKKDPPVAAPAPKPDPNRMKALLRKLEPWRRKHERTAWSPVLGGAQEAVAGSRMGGTPWLANDEDWPRCGSCRRPLQLFVQLDTATLPAEVKGRYGEGLIQLFYCVNDRALPDVPGVVVPPEVRPPPDACRANDSEAFSPAHLVRRVRPGPDGKRGVAPAPLRPFPERAIESWQPFADGPEAGEHAALGLLTDYDFGAKTVRVRVPELGIDEAGLPFAALEPLEEGCHVGDKLGGWPRWIQAVEYPACPRCSQPMQHVFQVDSEKGVPFMFGDVGIGHLTQCATHPDVLAFAWACS